MSRAIPRYWLFIDGRFIDTFSSAHCAGLAYQESEGTHHTIIDVTDMENPLDCNNGNIENWNKKHV